MEVAAINPNLGAALWITLCLVGLFIILRPLFRSTQPRVGSRIRVIKNNYGHGMLIMEKAWIIKIDDEGTHMDYQVLTYNNKTWYLRREEFEVC